MLVWPKWYKYIHLQWIRKSVFNWVFFCWLQRRVIIHCYNLPQTIIIFRYLQSFPSSLKTVATLHSVQEVLHFILRLVIVIHRFATILSALLPSHVMICHRLTMGHVIRLLTRLLQSGVITIINHQIVYYHQIDYQLLFHHYLHLCCLSLSPLSNSSSGTEYILTTDYNKNENSVAILTYGILLWHSCAIKNGIKHCNNCRP